MDLEEAGLIASWPAFLMWPVGALLIVAGLSGRLIRHLDDRRPADEVDGSIR
jgi:hypothetical protein